MKKKNKNPAAVELGKKGAAAQRKKVTKDQYREWGKKGAEKRWKKTPDELIADRLKNGCKIHYAKD